jgi:glycosyltransferase involved in cell wall biosynthesis
LKIAQIVGSIDPSKGGKERFVNDLTRELSKLGHDVTLITCDRTFKIGIDCNLSYIRSWTIPGLPPLPSFNDLIKQLQMGFDICHLHYHALFGETVALACKMRGLTLITTIHEEGKRGVHKMIYDRMLLNILSRLSHRIVCLTDGMMRVLVKRGLNNKKIVVIPNAMYVKELQSQVNKLKDDVHCHEGFDLIFVGRLEKRKGVHYLLKALLILKEKGFKPTLKIVGEGICKHKLMSFVRRNDLSSQVVITGYISQEELLKSYFQARCVVIPSLYEGTPNRVAIEALALGKLVITTSIPGMEIMSSSKLGIVVPPKNDAALARAILKALNLKDDELHRIKSAAKKFVQQYDWSQIMGQILELYQNH